MEELKVESRAKSVATALVLSVAKLESSYLKKTKVENEFLYLGFLPHVLESYSTDLDKKQILDDFARLVREPLNCVALQKALPKLLAKRSALLINAIDSFPNLAGKLIMHILKAINIESTTNESFSFIMELLTNFISNSSELPSIVLQEILLLIMTLKERLSCLKPESEDDTHELVSKCNQLSKLVTSSCFIVKQVT